MVMIEITTGILEPQYYEILVTVSYFFFFRITHANLKNF